MTAEAYMRTAPAGKVLARMCLPAMGIMLVIVLYNMTDLFFVGMTGDSAQLAAVSLAGPVFSALSGLGALVGAGGSTAAAMALGEGDANQARRVSGFCCYAALALGAAFALGAALFRLPIARWLGAEGESLGHTADYILILALGAPAVLFSNVFSNVIRADGSALQAMAANMLGTVLNVVLDPVLILWFHMGVSGAALATVAGNAGACLYLIWVMNRKGGTYALSPRWFPLGQGVGLRVLALGCPMALNTLLMSASSAFSNQLFAGYGQTVVAACGVAGKLPMLISMLGMGVAMGIQPALSYNYGAGDFKRIRRLAGWTAAVGLILCAVLTGLCAAFGEVFLPAFSQDVGVLECGKRLLAAALISCPASGLYHLASALFQSADRVGWASIISVVRHGALGIALAWLGERWFGLVGLAYSGAAAELLATAVCVLASGLFLKDMGRRAKTQATH